MIGSVKAYKPGHLVKHDDVRALLGVLNGEQDASKAIIATTSDFAPLISSDPFIKPYLPTRLELMNGNQLMKWLSDLAGQGTKQSNAVLLARSTRSFRDEHVLEHIPNAPGLVWRKQKVGYTAFWQAETKAIIAGFRPRIVPLFRGIELTDADRHLIIDATTAMQHEMLIWLKKKRRRPIKLAPPRA